MRFRNTENFHFENWKKEEKKKYLQQESNKFHELPHFEDGIN